jgi:2-polyprenyl-6-methoxyphenol hydroxylase-like FAD-dependent oxidoreductase
MGAENRSQDTPRALHKALVVGGGIGGMAAAIGLRRLGIAVDLVEIDPQWRVYGAGITISPSTVRSFAQLGIMDQIRAHGFCGDGIEIYDMAGNYLTELPTQRLAGPQIPSGGAIMRPVLRELLSQATLLAGVAVRLGVTFESIDQDGRQARVAFTDGTSETYELVVGADGLRSKVRRYVFPEAPQPTFTGQGCWRAVVPRRPDVVRARFFMGVRDKAGVNPVSQEEMYLFLNATERAQQPLEESELPRLLAQRLGSYGGLVADIRASLNPASRVLYRPLERLLLPPPWYRGRVLLIGDAAHSTTPHLASGAGIAVEDALVLTEELVRATDIDQALEHFMERRYERCRMVVENSVRLGEIEQHGGSQAEHAQLMRDSIAALAAPI